MSSFINTHSDDEMEFHSDSGSESEYEPEVGAEDDDDTVERGDHETDIGVPVGPNQQGAQTSSTSMGTGFILSGTPSTDCPSPALAHWARGKFDPKSPLKQFATRITTGQVSGGTRKWRCNICGEEWYGSITRVNAHFLFWTGKGVLPCKFLAESKNLKIRIEFNKLWGVPEDLGLPVPTTLAGRQQIQTIQEVHEHQIQGQQRRRMSSSRPQHRDSSTSLLGAASAPSSTHSSIGVAAAETSKGKRRAQSSDNNPIAELFAAQTREKLDAYIGRMLFANGVPIHIARSPYFKEAFQKVAKAGLPSYVPPGEHKLRTKILDDEYAKISESMETMRAVWEESGCSIIMDGWTDIRHRPLINVIVTCAEGPFFLRAVDCSGHRKDADFQFQILREAIEEIGPQNVVQVVTDAAHVCRAAGRLIEATYQHIWWTPCCVHAMNNALKDMGKISWIKGVVSDARDVQMYICNHHTSHALFRSFAKKEFLKPVETRYASYFILLERMLELQEPLQLMVMTNEWNRWDGSRSEQGMRVKDIVKSDVFWSDAKYIVSIIRPVFEVIRYGDGDAPTLGEVYECIDSMLGQMRAVVREKDPTLGFYNDHIRPIIQRRWDKLNTPLHMAAYALNPRWYMTRPGRVTPLHDDEVKEGFFKCIGRMYDPETAAKVRIEWTKFATLKGYKQAAKADIKTMAQEDPILWWSAYGPKSTTTTLAIRLLSQVSSSSASERNWSTYSFIHSLKRNRLTSQRAEKLVAVHSALRINDRNTCVYKESPASRWDVEPEEPSQIDEEDALDPATGLVGVPFSSLDLGETDSSSGDEFQVQPAGDDDDH